MGLKKQAIRELEALMKEFGVTPSRLGRDLFNDPSFISRLKRPETKITDVALDKVFRYAITLRGQGEMSLDAKERRKPRKKERK